MVSSPVIQYYYTQFIGDANEWPTIKGTADFKGIALIDTDVYIPGKFCRVRCDLIISAHHVQVPMEQNGISTRTSKSSAMFLIHGCC